MKPIKFIILAAILVLPFAAAAEIKQFTYSANPSQNMSVIIREEASGRTSVMQRDNDTGVCYWVEMPQYNPGDLRLPYPNQPKPKK